MFKKYFSDKINLIEGSIITFSLILFFITKIRNQFATPELVINLFFLALLVTSFVFRSSNLRHMHFAFIFLILSVLENVFGFSNFLYITGSLALSLFILGIINMLLFKNEN